MRMQVVAIMNTYSEGYVLLGKAGPNLFFKARFSDYNQPRYSSSPKVISLNDILDTNDFDNIVPMSQSDAKYYMAANTNR